MMSPRLAGVARRVADVSGAGGVAARYVAAVGMVAVAAPAAVSADSFTPVRLDVRIASVARLNQPLSVTVSVQADPSALDPRVGDVRARVKLSSECGGDFEQTPGTTLLDAPLSPQPSPGRAFSGLATGSGRPTSYGTVSVCVYVEDSESRNFATETDLTVDVSQLCTERAAGFDHRRAAVARALTALRRARSARSRARLRRALAADRRSAAAAQRSARGACGAGVPL